MRHSSFRVGVIATAAMLVGLGTPAAVRAADQPLDPALNFAATPGPTSCGDNAHPEITQGRVPLADYASGRAAEGYNCNATQVSHVGSSANGTGASGGYRVYRYTRDAGHHVCAFYDTTLLFPLNAQAPGPDTGVWVLDMGDPSHPIHTATLSTPAMQSPHESFSLNVTRGLLGAVMGNPAAYPGQFDLYDVSQDCRHPVLKATLPMGVLGHEGSFTPDGLTYYASSLYGHTLTAIDVSNSTAPTILWTSLNWNVHGMNLSDDGNTLYFADLARNGLDQLGAPAGSATKGLTVLDVSQIQARKLNPQVSVISHLTWPHVGTPQTALPVTIGGLHYLVEIDEFGGVDNVGAARIIDVETASAPKVVSNMRLAVNNLENQGNPDQQKDPNATNSLQGYRGHYCSVPREVDPEIVACSFILSGLRVFDIRDPLHPREIAYFNQPSTHTNAAQGPQGAYAMSQPAFDIGSHQIWYSDGNSGFYDVQIADNVWPTTLAA